MKSHKVLFVFFLVFFSFYSQAQVNITDDKLEQLNNSQNSELNLKINKEVDCEIIGYTYGTSSGFKFVPWLPIFPRLTTGVVQFDASVLEAEKMALKSSGGDLLLDKKVEVTRKGFLFVLWLEKIEVTGIAVKIKSN